MPTRKNKSPSAIVRDVPDLTIARVVLNIMEHATPEELCEWAESLGLCTVERTAEILSADVNQLAALLVLFFMESERHGPSLIQIRDRRRVLDILYPLPAELGDIDEIRERLTTTAEIDGETFSLALSQAQRLFIGLAAWKHLQDGEGDVPLNLPPKRALKALAELSSEEVEELPRVVGRRLHEFTFEERHEWRAGDILNPGAAASFCALGNHAHPWQLEDKPWERERQARVRVDKLRWLEQKPAKFKVTEFDGDGIFDPLVRARARIVGRQAPTGMRLAVLRHQEQLIASGRSAALSPLLSKHAPTPDYVHVEGPKIVEWLKQQKAGPVEALVEMCELIGTHDPDDNVAHSAFWSVAAGYDYPEELRPFFLPSEVEAKDEQLRLADVESIAMWTTNRQQRYLLFDVLQRLKGIIDPLGRVCVHADCFYNKNYPGAFTRASRELYRAVLPLLRKHVWQEQAAHGRGRGASVYLVRYRFAAQGMMVSEDLLREQWGAPYGAGGESR